jgi:hypothetical protein
MNRNDRIIAIVACLAALAVVPEVRRFVGLHPIDGGDHSAESHSSSTVSTQAPRSPGPQALVFEKQSGHESTAPSSRIKTQPAEVTDVGSAPSVPGFTADGRQDRPSVHLQVRVLPKDTSVYLDSKFIGTAEDLSGGAWVPIGRHIVTFVRPGYESREYKIVVDQGVRGIQATLTPQR